MKTKFFIIAALIIPMAAMGQIIQRTVPEVKVTPPVFTGKQNVINLMNRSQQQSINDYLSENIRFPETAVKFLEMGTGVVRFTVESNGKLADFEVINSVSPKIDAEFIRVLKTTEGMWIPGRSNGDPVEMEKEVSMMFVSGETEIPNPREYLSRIAEVNWSKGTHLFLKKGNPKKALKYYDNSIKYLPFETSSLLLRGLCRYELGNQEGACSDWNRINEIGKYNATEFIDNLCGLKGYEEMVDILKNENK